MAFGLLGKKLGTAQVNDGERGRVPVTLIEVGPCLVLAKKTVERDGYTALKLAFGAARPKRTPKAQKAVFEKMKTAPRRFVREFRIGSEELAKYEEGGEITVAEVFKAGQAVNVAGRTKGRGFAGVMKRWNFKGFDATHGTHEFFRHGGSIGQRKFPGLVHKNKKMPGQYGTERVTIRNLRVVNLIPDKNCLLVQGAVPGSVNSLVEVYPA